MICRRWFLIIILFLLLGCLAMKKTSDEELNRWRLDDKRAPVSLRINGDRFYAQRFLGEAKSILWSLKNNMRFNKLKQGQRIIPYSDGTRIIAQSLSGIDIITIDVSRSVALATGAERASCIITLKDVPLYVSPMRYPGLIMEGEVEGVDYFKTYYSIDKTKCPNCQATSWEFLFKYLQSSPAQPTRIEWPIEPLHYQVFDADGNVISEDLSDHTVYSLFPPAWGEIISEGVDSGGSYIIWKAYTETGTISRTGQGIMRLVARVKDIKGEEICAQNARIEVDCCRKDAENRKLELWWTVVPDGGGYSIEYQGKKLYKVPSEVSIEDIDEETLHTIIELNGSCIPLNWNLTGYGTLIADYPGVDGVYKKPPDMDVVPANESPGKIKVVDRCGDKEVAIEILSCCNNKKYYEEPAIEYTTLIMGINTEQDLSVVGGCGPFTWEDNGVGSLVVDPDDSSKATYTAPASAADCPKALITVTDGCSGQGNIEISIYNPAVAAQVAGYHTTWEFVGTCESKDPSPVISYWFWRTIYYVYCNGTEKLSIYAPTYMGTQYPAAPGVGENYCAFPKSHDEICSTVDYYWNGTCPYTPTTIYAGFAIQNAGFFGNGYKDARTAAQIANGCCPPQFS